MSETPFDEKVTAHQLHRLGIKVEPKRHTHHYSDDLLAPFIIVLIVVVLAAVGIILIDRGIL